MGRIIGTTTCVATDEKSDVFYAQRRGRKTLSRFVQNVSEQDCDTITVIIARNKAYPNRFNLITAYIGFQAEKEPLDPSIQSEEEFLKSKAFWDTHALVKGSQRIYKETITTECPWDKFSNRPIIKLGKNNNVGEMIQKMREKVSEPLDVVKVEKPQS